MFKTLVVEDSPFFRKLLKEMLGSRFPSMEIHEAADGEEALKKVEILLPELVFMDIKLPGESGIDLTQRIKDRHPETIVIILSAYDLPEYRDSAYRHKADHFLSKGTSSKEEILSLVQSVLSRWQNNVLSSPASGSNDRRDEPC